MPLQTNSIINVFKFATLNLLILSISNLAIAINETSTNHQVTTIKNSNFNFVISRDLFFEKGAFNIYENNNFKQSFDQEREGKDFHLNAIWNLNENFQVGIRNDLLFRTIKQTNTSNLSRQTLGPKSRVYRQQGLSSPILNFSYIQNQSTRLALIYGLQYKVPLKSKPIRILENGDHEISPFNEPGYLDYSFGFQADNQFDLLIGMKLNYRSYLRSELQNEFQTQRKRLVYTPFLKYKWNENLSLSGSYEFITFLRENSYAIDNTYSNNIYSLKTDYQVNQNCSLGLKFDYQNISQYSPEEKSNINSYMITPELNFSF